MKYKWKGLQKKKNLYIINKNTKLNINKEILFFRTPVKIYLNPWKMSQIHSILRSIQCPRDRNYILLRVSSKKNWWIYNSSAPFEISFFSFLKSKSTYIHVFKYSKISNIYWIIYFLTNGLNIDVSTYV